MKYDSVLYALALSVLLLFASTSFAADQVFLKIDGVVGESTGAGHNGQIDVLSWSVGASVPFEPDPVAGGSGPGEPPDVQDLSIVKWIDTATPPLLMAMLDGQHFPEATLTVSTGGESPVDYFTIEMKDVVLTSMATGGVAGEGRVKENVTLAFAQFCATYTLIAEDGTEQGQSEVCYDIAANI